MRTLASPRRGGRRGGSTATPISRASQRPADGRASRLGRDGVAMPSSGRLVGQAQGHAGHGVERVGLVADELGRALAAAGLRAPAGPRPRRGRGAARRPRGSPGSQATGVQHHVTVALAERPRDAVRQADARGPCEQSCSRPASSRSGSRGHRRAAGPRRPARGAGRPGASSRRALAAAGSARRPAPPARRR